MARRSSVLSKRPLGVAALLLVVALVGLSLEGCFSAPRYSGPVTDHFAGKRFRNQVPIEDRGFGDVLRWRLSRKAEIWKGYRPEIVKSPVVERVDGGDLRVTFIGHATVLIQIAGLNVLTDPIWAKRASPLSWAGPKRFAPPGLDLDELPPIDAVVVSHNHYDHLSVSTLRELTRRGVPLVLAPLGNKELLDRRGIAGARDLDWWETHRIDDGVSITCVPAQHFSGRGLSDRMATLWGGFVIETPDGVVYYAGDTGVGPHFAQVRERFGPPRLAVLPIGAYRPAWFMQPVHVDPREAAEAHLTLGARTSLAVHYGCFELADEGPTTPVLELDEACTSLGIPRDEFWTLAIGEARDAP